MNRPRVPLEFHVELDVHHPIDYGTTSGRVEGVLVLDSIRTRPISLAKAETTFDGRDDGGGAAAQSEVIHELLERLALALTELLDRTSST